MNKVAQYLQEHLLGEVTDHPDIRRHYSRDASVLEIEPAIIVYPRTEEDIRKTASFSWQLARREQLMPITARGAGNDTSGAAIGPGIVMVLPEHINQIIQLDTKHQQLTVQSGASFETINQSLITHSYFLPPYPAKADSTIGGALANNALGEKSVKYGTAGAWVNSLRVVLSNGEVIETGPLNKKELGHKMGLTTFEGEIYRALDKLLEENQAVIEGARKKHEAAPNSAGYDLFHIKNDGTFDLTPLFVGSQGSLGIITEASLNLAVYTPQTAVCLVSIPKIGGLNEVTAKILKLEPSIFMAVNRQMLEQIAKINPGQNMELTGNREDELYLLVEFDNHKENDRDKAAKTLRKIIERTGGKFVRANDEDETQKINTLFSSIPTVLAFARGPAKAVPLAESIAVPTGKIEEFMRHAYKIYDSAGLPPAAYGNIGSGMLRFQPLLELGNLGDRQKWFKISAELYDLAVELGGTISAGGGEGRIRAPFIEHQYGQQLKILMDEVKRIFDPYGILNPGIKSAIPDDIKAFMSDS